MATTEKTYGRKSYMGGEDDDYLSQMSRVPRRAMEVQDNGETPRSVFDKPYVSDNYTEMEQFQPFPLPDPIPITPVNPPEPSLHSVGDQPVPPPVPPPGSARISLQSPFKCCPKLGQTCKDRGATTRFAHARVGVIDTSEHPPKGGTGTELEEIWNNAIQVFHNGEAAPTTYIKGQVWPLCIQSTRPDLTWKRGDTLYACIRGNKGTVIADTSLRITCFTDPNCCDCDDLPEGVLTFDDASTPDTIVKGSAISIYVTGGCPPFTFSTNSLGYTFNEGVTSYSTEMRTANLACVTGTCGTNYAVVANFTITDGCGSSVSSSVRNTSGQWSGLNILNYFATKTDNNGITCLCSGADSNHVTYTYYNSVSIITSKIYRWISFNYPNQTRIQTVQKVGTGNWASCAVASLQMGSWASMDVNTGPLQCDNVPGDIPWATPVDYMLALGTLPSYNSNNQALAVVLNRQQWTC